MSVERRRRPGVPAALALPRPATPASPSPGPVTAAPMAAVAVTPASGTPGTTAGTTRRTMSDGRLCSTCASCGHVEYAPDKGLGRARLAAWESRHGIHCAGPAHQSLRVPSRIVRGPLVGPTIGSAMRVAGFGSGRA